jgi:lysophospholipase L1-like esterase
MADRTPGVDLVTVSVVISDLRRDRQYARIHLGLVDKSRRRLVAVVAGMAILGGSCAQAPDILAQGERDQDPLETAAVASGTSGVQPTPAPVPTPTPLATPTASPVPTATPEPTQTARPTPTPTPTPIPVDVIAQVEVRVEVGSTLTTPFVRVTADSSNPVVSLDIENPPPGLEGVTRFAPTQPGTWHSTVVVVDDAGNVIRESIVFVARYRARPNAVVAMGDSIASGHGLQISDYLGRDRCFRSNDGYPRRVVDALVDAGDLPAGTELGLVACSGVDSDDLSSELVDGGISGTEPVAGGRRTQLEWAVHANPALIFLSVGINDLGFVNPSKFITDGRLDEDVIGARLQSLRSELESVLDELVAKTDSRIVVTGYYNPTAERPQGIAGCETSCFRAVTEAAVEQINDAIVKSLPVSDRVLFAELASIFEGHGAPNGLGPDGLRAGNGFLGDLLGSYTEGIQAYCAKGDTSHDAWVNSVDCVHPTKRGAGEIASAVLTALDAV